MKYAKYMRLMTMALGVAWAGGGTALGQYSGEIAPGRYVVPNGNITLTNVILKGDTEFVAYNGKIIVQSSGGGTGVSCKVVGVVDGGPEESPTPDDCSTGEPSAGQPGRRGYNLVLRTSASTFGSAAPNDIEINAPIDLSAEAGGRGGSGANGTFNTEICCDTLAQHGHDGSRGGNGGELTIESGADIIFRAGVVANGGDGGNGGDAGYPSSLEFVPAYGIAGGAGGHGGSGGSAKLIARNIVISDDGVQFNLNGGAGGAGGFGAGLTLRHRSGGDGGKGGFVHVYCRNLIQSTFPGSSDRLSVDIKGGAGGPGGAGWGGGDTRYLCGPICGVSYVQGPFSAYGGRGGQCGSGGVAQFFVNGVLRLPHYNSIPGLLVDASSGNGANDSAPSGGGGRQRLSETCVGCWDYQPPLGGPHGVAGGRGGIVNLNGSTVTLTKCDLRSYGGAGGKAGQGGAVHGLDQHHTACQPLPSNGNGGNGGPGGSGGTITVSAAYGSMDCTGGTAGYCGGNGGDGAKPGCGPGGAGAVGSGGLFGPYGRFFSAGSGTRPTTVVCTLQNGANGTNCP